MNPPNRMTCEHVFRLLDDYLDHELTPQETAHLREHLEICVMCAKEFRFQAEVIEAVRERVQHIVMPATLRDKVTAALKKAQRESLTGC